MAIERLETSSVSGLFLSGSFNGLVGIAVEICRPFKEKTVKIGKKGKIKMERPPKKTLTQGKVSNLNFF